MTEIPFDPSWSDSLRGRLPSQVDWKAKKPRLMERLITTFSLQSCSSVVSCGATLYCIWKALASLSQRRGERKQPKSRVAITECTLETNTVKGVSWGSKSTSLQFLVWPLGWGWGAKLHAGRFWKKNKHICKNSKGLWVKLYGCGTALGAEECIFDRKEVLFICCYEQKCKSVSVTLKKIRFVSTTLCYLLRL